MRGDLIEMYKIVRGIDQVNSHSAPRLDARGHRFKKRVDIFNRNLRGNFFTQSYSLSNHFMTTEVTATGR